MLVLLLMMTMTMKHPGFHDCNDGDVNAMMMMKPPRISLRHQTIVASWTRCYHNTEIETTNLDDDDDVDGDDDAGDDDAGDHCDCDDDSDGKDDRRVVGKWETMSFPLL